MSVAEFLKPTRWKIIVLVIVVMLYLLAALRMPILYLPGQICNCENWSCNLKECNANCGEIVLLPVLFVSPYSLTCSESYKYLGLSDGLEFTVVLFVQLVLLYLISCLIGWGVGKIIQKKRK